MGVYDTFWWALGYDTPALSQALNSSPPPPSPADNTLKPGLAVAIMSGTFVGMSALFWPFIAPVIRRHVLPFIPATDMQVKNVVRGLEAARGSAKASAAGASNSTAAVTSMVDLGSGDGRLVIAAAEAGFKGTGVELNPWLNVWAAVKSMKAGTSSKTSFTTSDLWKFSCADYDNVVIFGVAEMMPELQGKLTEELGEDARLLVCRFPIPDLVPTETFGSGIDSVWLYDLRNAEVVPGYLPPGAPMLNPEFTGGVVHTSPQTPPQQQDQQQPPQSK
eukprot:gene10324-25505_t